jgi:hypothetical protein
MPRSKKNAKKRNRKTKAKEEKSSFPSIVGPDVFLLLQGRLFDDGGTSSGGNSILGNLCGGKNVSLILCGESHNDAIDVTRRSPPGKFEPTEGWTPVFDSTESVDGNDIYTALPRALFVPSRRETAVPHSIPHLQPPRTPTPTPQPPMLPSIENLALRYLHPVNGRKNKPVTLERARELASAFVGKHEIEEDMFGRNLLLLWVTTPGYSDRTEKGEAFLLEIETEVKMDAMDANENGGGDDDDDSNGSGSDDDEEEYDDWVFFTSNSTIYDNPLQQHNRFELPDLLVQWMDDVMMVVHGDESTAATLDDAIDDISDDGNNENDCEGQNANMRDATAERMSEDGEGTVSSMMHRRLMHRRLGRYVLFEYGDLDSVAHDISKRRLGMTDAALTSSEYDDVIETRKRALKEEDNVWTFDDWFDHVKAGGAKMGDVVGINGGDQPQAKTNGVTGSETPSVHLILEASVPPWEVELHRPRLKDESTGGDGTNPASTAPTTEAEYFRLHPAAQCVRCLSEDSEESWEEEYDPSNDGIGSYTDFIYRKMMTATMRADSKQEKEEAPGVPEEEKKSKHGGVIDGDEPDISTIANQSIHHDQNKNENGDNNWLHCIDVRDLGCESACHAESAKQQWYDLLLQEERGVLSNPEDVAKDACPVNEKGDAMRFLPANKLNPEWIELERLISEGLLVREKDGDAGDGESEYERDEELLEFTFPSFECFFGGNSDNMYYSPHVKLAYSPFLFHCVKSLDTWNAFFTALFFGGTISEAIEMLNLRAANSRESVHIRSPILQQWDPQSNSYVWKERDKEEDYVTCPYFPFAFHLVAKGSSPPRTWSSQLFANLHDFDERQSVHPIPNTQHGVALAEGQSGHHQPKSRRGVALAIKNWIIDSIHSNMDDPKGSDDEECGGEWFASYLRAVYRDIYDDIDNSDSAVLLQKNYMKSLSRRRLKKHNIGKIKIPSAKDAFKEILARFEEQENLPPTDNVVTPRVEVLAKIIIDIWVSNLFDFSLLLKIANICANETNENVVVVCYVGSAHAKAAGDFFCGAMGFQRTAVVGKFTWEDDELQTLDLPSKFWNLSELFR